MGNCCSGGKDAVGGAGTLTAPDSRTVLNEATDLFLRSRGYSALHSYIEVFVSASNLLDRDVFSKSDPMAVVFTKKSDGTLEEIGRTEVVLNSLNPAWITKFTVIFYFENVQSLVFKVYDIDTQFHNVPVKTLRLDDQQYIGEATCTLSEIVTKPTRALTLQLEGMLANEANAKRRGELTIRAEEHFNSKVAVEMLIRCSNLENKDLFSKSDPFLVLTKIVENGAPIPLCKTEVKKNNLNPTWKPLVLNLQQVGSKDNPLVLECLNFNSNGKHDLIGKVQKSLSDLENMYNQQYGENLFTTIDHVNKVSRGQLFVQEYHEREQYTFLDYIADGYELNFMVAIDFTASNGNPKLPDSLHYIDQSGRYNAYQRAIVEVGGVLQFYDSDKKFPAWGFGARPIDGPVSHCFNLNGSNHHKEVDGIAGIMSAYSSALQNVALAGPTLFGHVVSQASQIARESAAKCERRYFVLLIITDGVITDLQETIDAIVEASDLPFSILIVGVGGADFKEMEFLDADKVDKLENSAGKVATRDIVQFVPMRAVQHGEVSVVQSLLSELPSQFLSYMRSKNLVPLRK